MYHHGVPTTALSRRTGDTLYGIIIMNHKVRTDQYPNYIISVMERSGHPASRFFSFLPTPSYHAQGPLSFSRSPPALGLKDDHARRQR